MAYNKTNPNGQATMANSSPVVVASNQSAVPVSAASLPLPTGAATEASLATIAAAVKAEDAAHTSGDTGIMAQAVRNDALGTTFTNANGDISPIAVNSTGAVFMATTSMVPGTGATNLGKAEDAAHASGDTGVMALGVRNDANTAISGADGDYTPFATDSQGNQRIIGEVAHDAVDAGRPVKVGGQARTTNPGAIADGDRSNFVTDKLGKQIVVGSIREMKVQQATTISNTSETTVLSAGAAGVFHDVYGVIITNTSATATEVAFKDATAGTTRFTISAPANDTRGFMLPESAAHSQASAANNWTATAADAVTSLEITVMAVKNL
jgi:hypothetical protein